MEGSMLSSKSHLFPQKPSIWPPCGSVLTGGMHNGSSLIHHSNYYNLPYLVTDDLSDHQWKHTFRHCEGFVQTQPVFYSATVL